MKRKIIWLVSLSFVGFCMMLLSKVPALGLDGPDFCGSCHVMQEQVDTYLHSAHQLGATCGDCHIPHDLVYGAAYKAYTGTRDIVAVVANIVPEDIKVTNQGKKVIQDNCIRCHGDFLEQVGDTMRSGGRNCFDCHRHTPHQR